MLNTITLTKRFGRNIACDAITLNVPINAITGLVGPNGAGKTTLLRMLSGQLKPDSGDIYINDRLVSDNPKDLREFVSILPDGAPSDSDMSVKEYLIFRQSLKNTINQNLIDYWVEKCELKEVYMRPIGNLSRGYKQRVGLAGAIVCDTKIILLDEPSTGLDPSQKELLTDLLLNLSETKTVLYSSHQLGEIQRSCGHIAVMNHGKVLIEGSPKDIVTKTLGSLSFYISSKDNRINEIFSNIQNLKVIKSGINKNDFYIIVKGISERENFKNEIHRILVLNNCIPTELYEHGGTLEKAYMKLIERNT
tara:strand:- start:539 stop:1459 length:921 start_codon:yes stop_codon:yes gene_type:complete